MIAKTDTENNVASWIYVPAEFDPQDYPGPIARHPDAARWMLNCIYFNHVIRNYDKEEYVNLHSELLAKVMGGQDYVRPIRIALEEAGLIVCDHTWTRHVKSLGYKLGPLLADSAWIRYTSNDKRFLKRIVNYKTHVQTPQGFTLPVHEYLRGWAEHVEIADAEFTIEKEDPVKKAAKERLAHDQIDLIKANYRHYSVCRYGRFHSNYTGLCREVRPLLRVQGEPLCEVDVTNSQPFFLGLLLSEVSQNGRCSPNYSSSSLQTGRAERALPYVSGLRCKVNDLGEYLEAVAAGRFYESLMNSWSGTRDELKQKSFEVIYGNTGTMLHSALTDVFRTKYPRAFELTARLKAEKGYRWVGQELQRRESELLIGGVCDTLRLYNPDVPILTIHDSVLTTRGNLDVVEQLIAQQFRAKYGGITPKLKRKYHA